mmetsp:Transcript_25392/g.45830  ORF Transcript_25392/g.45830 Transcript_25392/m.45830 type:complete len:558 (-) Transcript_25392:153-1826(-)
MAAPTPTVQFEGLEDYDTSESDPDTTSNAPRRGGPGPTQLSAISLLSAPPVPPHEHRRSSLLVDPSELSMDDERGLSGDNAICAQGGRRGTGLHRYTYTFGGLSKRAASREIHQERNRTVMQKKKKVLQRDSSQNNFPSAGDPEAVLSDTIGSMTSQDEASPLMNKPSSIRRNSYNRSSPMKPLMITDDDDSPMEALKEMFLESKINLLFAVLPFAWWSHHAHWPDSTVFALNFLAMVPLASMLGVFTEELAMHTNDVIGGLINATFGNAVEMVVAIQALLADDFRVVQASLIGSIFSNLLLVLGMCFLCGGIKHSEQEFIAQGAVASIALLGFFGLMLLMPEFFTDGQEDGGDGKDVEMTISRIGALLLILMYGQLLFFQLNTHVHLFEGDDDVAAIIPFSWALTGLVVITGVVTLFSEYLVGSIDGFCEEFHLGRSFVGVILIPVVGNAVEHISAVTVAMKNKMDLALGIALGSSVQIGLFVLPMVVLVGELTGKNMSMQFPRFEVYLYLLSVIIVSLCLTNQRSNWLEGSLLVFTYVIIAVGIYFEEEDIDHDQ